MPSLRGYRTRRFRRGRTKRTLLERDHGGRLTTVMRAKSEVTTQEDEDGHVRVTVKDF